DVVDISLDSVKYARADVNAKPPKDTMILQNLAAPQVPAFDDISKVRNRSEASIKFLTDTDTSLRDFYWKYARGLEPYDTSQYAVAIPSNLEMIEDSVKQKFKYKYFYELTFSNKGGLVMPIIIEWTYKDGSKEIDRIPAQVWRYNENKVVKFYMKDKEVATVKIDPMRETADIDESNNSWGQITQEPSRFQLFKQKQGAARGQSTGINPMQKSAEKKGF
ncbi:MAG: M1 family peptidase, partial [Chitinophagaceae bacterium]|nr:M1 family peptidase [Chitinophagaceae bacterium]